MRRPHALIRDEGGASIVEMGLAAPLLATFLLGMIDLSGAYSAKLQVEQAAQRTIEYVQRNGFTAGQESTLQTEAQTAAGTGSTATVTSWSECNGTTGAFNASCTTPPISRYIRVSVTKPYTPYLKIRWGGNANGTYTVRGSAGLRIQ
jgi:Flp pilus assembly protein TadG